MSIGDLIDKLLKIEKEHGKDLPVLVYDGMDPSDLDRLVSCEVEKRRVLTDHVGTPERDCLVLHS